MGMSELLAAKLRRWRGKRYRKEAAALLDIPLTTYRKYEVGMRTPNKLALAELERRIEQCDHPTTNTPTAHLPPSR
jgi:hypothetical protein